MQFVHDASAMHFDGVLADSELVGDLLVEHSLGHELANLALAFGQEREPFGGVALRARLLLLGNGLLTGPRQRLEQLRLIDGLDEKVEGAFAHRACRRRHVAFATEKDDWPGVSTPPQIVLNVEAALTAEAQIEEQAGDVVARWPLRSEG